MYSNFDRQPNVFPTTQMSQIYKHERGGTPPMHDYQVGRILTCLSHLNRLLQEQGLTSSQPNPATACYILKVWNTTYCMSLKRSLNKYNLLGSSLRITQSFAYSKPNSSLSEESYAAIAMRG